MDIEQNEDTRPTDSEIHYCRRCKTEIYCAYGMWFSKTGNDFECGKKIHWPKIESPWESYKKMDPARAKHPVLMLLLDIGVGVFLFFMMMILIGGIGNLIATSL